MQNVIPQLLPDRALLELAWDAAIDGGQSSQPAHRALDLYERSHRTQLTFAEETELRNALMAARRIVDGAGADHARAA